MMNRKISTGLLGAALGAFLLWPAAAEQSEAPNSSTAAPALAETATPWQDPDGPVAESDPAAEAALVTKVEDYLNGIRTMQARFVQYEPDGGISEGAFYLERPGKLRFDYEPPSQILVVGDGRWLVLIDKELKQLTRWPINKTHLNFLTEDTIDLDQDASVEGVEARGNILRLVLRDRKNPGEGQITLVFETAPMRLRQWQVIDAQGLVTVVSLDNARYNVAVNEDLFTYEDPRRRPRQRGARP